jgi:hypothetical protein
MISRELQNTPRLNVSLKCKAQMLLYQKKKKKKEAQMPLTQKASMIHN